jgi:sulfur carrier protein ThiS
MVTGNDTIRVTVTLQAGLRKYAGGARDQSVSLPIGATLEDLIDRLGMVEEDVWIIGVNGVLAQRGHVLSYGDHVEFFEPIAGG